MKREAEVKNLVHVSIDEKGIATVSLNRPEAANALSLELLNEFQRQLLDIKKNETIRCIVLTAEGNKVFCAGADLKERKTMDESQVKQAVSLIRETVNLLEQLPQPVIAALNGSAFGGGLELALACDIRIAASDCTIGLTETSLAIIPGAGGTQRLPRLIGKGKAKELIYTARKIEANEALNIGLVEFVVAKEDVLNKAMEMAERISMNGPVAVRQAKFAIDKGVEVPLEIGLSIEQKAYEITIPTKDRKEGLLAFQEKRTPRYEGY